MTRLTRENAASVRDLLRFAKDTESESFTGPANGEFSAVTSTGRSPAPPPVIACDPARSIPFRQHRGVSHAGGSFVSPRRTRVPFSRMSSTFLIQRNDCKLALGWSMSSRNACSSSATLRKTPWRKPFCLGSRNPCVQRRTDGRGEVLVEPRMPFQPRRKFRMLVQGVVVWGQMQVQLRRRPSVALPQIT